MASSASLISDAGIGIIALDVQELYVVQRVRVLPPYRLAG